MSLLLWTPQDKFASKTCRETQWLWLPPDQPLLGVHLAWGAGRPRSPMPSSQQHWLLQPELHLGGSQACVSGDPGPTEDPKGARMTFWISPKGRSQFWGREHSTPRRTQPSGSCLLLTAPSAWTRRAVDSQGQLPHTATDCLCPIPTVHPSPSVCPSSLVCLPLASVCALLFVPLTSAAGDACCWL